MSGQSDGDLTSKISEIISHLTGKQAPSTKTDLASMGIDSMAKLDIMTALEQTFNVALGENSIREFVTISRITHVVHDAILAAKNT